MGGSDTRSLFDRCQKNPGHTNFTPVPKLKLNSLPRALRSQDNLATLRHLAERTVRLEVRTTSIHRPETYPGTTFPYPYTELKNRKVIRCGSGFITAVKRSKSGKKACSCAECKISKQTRAELCRIKIKTAKSVVYDKLELLDTIFECFYDSEDKSNVKRLYGIRARSWPQYEATTVTCTTHDEDLFARLQDLLRKSDSTLTSLLPDDKDDSWGVIISHPHGRSKHVSFGNHSCFASESDLPPPFFRGSLGEPIKYRLPKTSTQHDIADPAAGKSKDGQTVLLTPGEEHQLPKGTRCIFPPEFNGYLKLNTKSDEPWSILPPGTRFQLPVSDNNTTGQKVEKEEQDIVEFGPEVEFLRSSGLLAYCCSLHDIPTCPGSAGAPVFLACRAGLSSLSSLQQALPQQPEEEREWVPGSQWLDPSMGIHVGAMGDSRGISQIL